MDKAHLDFSGRDGPPPHTHTHKPHGGKGPSTPHSYWLGVWADPARACSWQAERCPKELGVTTSALLLPLFLTSSLEISF